MMARLSCLLLAACLAMWPNAVPAETGAAERWQWRAPPADVRSAYQALRNMPAFAAIIPRLFPAENDAPQHETDWRHTFTSSHFQWARINVNDNRPQVVILVLSAPGQPCPRDGCPGFVMAEEGTSDIWRIACELKTIDWSWPQRLRRRSLGLHWFTTGDLLVGWRRGTPGRSWTDGPVCFRAGRARAPDHGYMHGLQEASELYAIAKTDSPYAAVLRGTRPEDIGRPRGPEDWRRRFDPLLHLRSMRVHLAPSPGAVALMLASPLLCRDGRCPVAVVSDQTNVAPNTVLCTLDVPWDADIIRLAERDNGIQRLAIGDRLIGWRDAPENPRGIACTVSTLPQPG
jgi:hypothetical protein